MKLKDRGGWDSTTRWMEKYQNREEPTPSLQLEGERKKMDVEKHADPPLDMEASSEAWFLSILRSRMWYHLFM